jgi:heme/copper-type cytochrome/quinol oxidase subunit 4
MKNLEKIGIIEKIKTKKGMFLLGLILDFILTVICFVVWGITDNSHSVAVVTSMASIAAYTIYYFRRDGSLEGKHFLFGAAGIAIMAASTILIFFS